MHIKYFIFQKGHYREKTGDLCSLTFQLSKKILEVKLCYLQVTVEHTIVFLYKSWKQNEVRCPPFMTIYDAEERTKQGSGKIKEEYGYQQWDMMASPGLKCTFISPIFLTKLLLAFWVYTYF